MTEQEIKRLIVEAIERLVQREMQLCKEQRNV